MANGPFFRSWGIRVFERLSRVALGLGVFIYFFWGAHQSACPEGYHWPADFTSARWPGNNDGSAELLEPALSASVSDRV
jgi:hypothetical protein